MANLLDFKIIPILGRKVDVPADDMSMFRFIDERTAYTHDAGGLNFDLSRKRNTNTKSQGYSQWSNSANATANNCQGLFELYDGTNRDHIIVDEGKVYVYDSSFDPVDKSGAVTFATDNVDLFSFIKVGSDVVFADRGETTPYKWANGDATVTKLIDPSGGSGYTEYVFRYLLDFMRRIVGLYSTQTNGDIDIRWTDALPDLTGDVEFPAANQLYCPNDDPIVGAARMGQDRAFVYCENSINQLVYYPDYSLPFRIYTVVPSQGAVNHHSIVSLGDRHYLFNKNYGFCEYMGGNQLRPISQDIEQDLDGMHTAYYDLIVGIFIPLSRDICWTVPMAGEFTPNRLLFYNIDTGQFRWEDKAMRYVDNWQTFTDYTWNDLIAEEGTGVIWDTIKARTWSFYTSERQKLVYANTDGHLYYHTGESLAGSDLDGYLVTPMLDFLDKTRRDTIEEMWFDFAETSNFSIDISHRSGSTAGEVASQNWASAGSVSVDDPEYPVLRYTKGDKLHQFKIQADKADEKFAINGITFRYRPEGQY